MDPITLSKIDSAQKALEGRIAALETGAVALQSDVTTLKETSATKESVEAVQSAVDTAQSDMEAIKKAATFSPSALKIYSQTIEVPLVKGVVQPISVSASGACVIYSVIVAFEERSTNRFFDLPDFLLKIDGDTYFSGELGDGKHATYGFAERNLYEYYEYHSSNTGKGYISYPLGISPDIIFPFGDNSIGTNPANMTLPGIIAHPIYCAKGFSMSSGTESWGGSATKAATISLLYGVSTL